MLDQILAPLDYPRQALANLGRGAGRLMSGEAGVDDLLRAAPGAAGALTSALFGLPAGALAGGAAQGIGKMFSPDTFEAPSAGDVVEGLGGDRDSFLQTALAQMATDPLMYAGGLAGGKAARGLASGLPEVGAPTLATGAAAEIPEVQAMLTQRAGGRMPSSWADAPPPRPGPPGPRPPAFGTGEYDLMTQQAIDADAAAGAAAEARPAAPAPLPPAAPPAPPAYRPPPVDADNMRPFIEDIQARAQAKPSMAPDEMNQMAGLFGDMHLDRAPIGERMGLASDALEGINQYKASPTPELAAQLGKTQDQVYALRDLAPKATAAPEGWEPVARDAADGHLLMDQSKGFNLGMDAQMLSSQLERMELPFPSGGLADQVQNAMGGGLGFQPPHKMPQLLSALEEAGIPVDRDALMATYKQALGNEWTARTVSGSLVDAATHAEAPFLQRGVDTIKGLRGSLPPDDFRSVMGQLRQQTRPLRDPNFAMRNSFADTPIGPESVASGLQPEILKALRQMSASL